MNTLEVAWAQDIQAMDEGALAAGWSLEALVQRAAQGAFEVFTQVWPQARPQTTLILCGPGNNGADGAALGIQLHLSGHRVQVWVATPPKGPGLKTLLEKLQSLGAEVTGPGVQKPGDPDLSRADILVDGLFGVGFRGPLGPELKGLLEQINASGKPLLALDLPTGTWADGGTAEVSVQADHTVTFGFPKLGQLYGPGKQTTGTLWVKPLGLPENLERTRGRLHWVQESWFQTQSLRRNPASHKGQNGHVMILGGSGGLGQHPRMAGAPGIGAYGALKTGAGLVTLAVPRSLAPSLETWLPEALLVPLKEGDSRGARKALDGYLKSRHVDALVVGCGLALSSWARDLTVWALRDSQVPRILLDASALTLLAQDSSVQKALRQTSSQVLITPHPGEAARLLKRPPGEVVQDPVGALETLVQTYQTSVLLKLDSCFCSAPGKLHLLVTGGTPVLAQGGSGDLLAGITGALAPGRDLWEAGVLACRILAGTAQAWEQETGTQRGALTRNLADSIPRVLAKTFPC